MAMPDRRPSVKEQLRALADALPEDATWDEAAFEVALRQSQADIEESDAEYEARLRAMVERGRADARAGRSSSTNEVRARLGLPPL